MTVTLNAVESVRQTYSVDLPAVAGVEELLSPETWSGAADTLKAGDRLEVWARDGQLFAELLVLREVVGGGLELGLHHSSVHRPRTEVPVWQREFRIEQTTKSPGYTVWSIYRRSNDTWLRDKDSYDEALAWVLERTPSSEKQVWKT